jgi:hypothetical protein
VSARAAEARIGSALAAAGISLQRIGASRTARLRDRERSLYQWILRGFADGRPPDLAGLRRESNRLGIPLEDSLATFAREDLVHVDEGGSVAVAYPFSGRPTPHVVRFEGRELYAMCAIDALAIAPMLDLPIEVASSDPHDGQEIRVSVAPDGSARWQPEGAVVVAGRAGDGAAFRGCCQVLNFFASRENAGRHLREHADLSGFPISIPEAIEVGRLIFGDVLD